jgi:glycosyltransferase involved in cell wall biosynthesis
LESTRTRRLLLLSEGYPPDGGGVATSTRRLASRFASLGALTTVLTYQSGKTTDLNRAPSIEYVDGFRLIRLGPFFKAAGVDQEISLNEKHKAFLRRRFVDNAVALLGQDDEGPNLIFSMYVLNAGFLATHIAGTLEIPHIAGVRGNDIGRNVFDPTALYATRFVLERASGIACVNRHLQSRMLRVFPDLAGKSVVINNSIGPSSPIDRKSAREALIRKTSWPADSIICCFIGSFREKKGCLEIVQAAQNFLLRGSGPPIRLLLVSPPLGSTERVLIGAQLDELITRGVVCHMGVAGRENVRPLAGGADILLQPSLEDGMANALLEGMSIGLCPIVSQVFSDVVREGEGIVLPRSSAFTIFEAIATLGDQRVREKMGAAALRRAAEFHPDLEAGAYLSLFDAVCTGRLAPAGFEPGYDSSGACPGPEASRTRIGVGPAHERAVGHQNLRWDSP